VRNTVVRDAILGADGIELHVLASGSDGNCAVLQADGVSVMIDAGLSGRVISRLASAAGLDLKDVSAILITHEHGDHVKGAGVLSRRFDIPVYANLQTFNASNIGNVSSWVEFQTLSIFRIDDLQINPLPTSHHAVKPTAFSFSFDGKKCLVATDLGKVTPEIQVELEESDLAMLEANHDIDMLINGSYPPFLKTLIKGERGHLSNNDCAEALSKGHTDGRKVFLAHISKNNNRPEIARKTVAASLGCSADRLHCLEEEDEVKCVTYP
jgi:phosphoribosyl 1,2-cyclic phosphodiesterase